jgi:hypothetical protein
LKEVRAIIFDAIQMIEQSCQHKQYDSTLILQTQILSFYLQVQEVVNEISIV